MTAKQILYKHCGRDKRVQALAALQWHEKEILAAMEEYKFHDPNIPSHTDPIDLVIKLMRIKGVRQVDLVNLFGVHKSTVSCILRYKKNRLTAGECIKLAEYFNVPVDLLLKPYPLKNSR